MPSGVYKHKKGLIHTPETKDKIRKSLALFRLNHPNFMKKVRQKGLKKARKTYLAHPERWKRTKQEIKKMSKISKEWHKKHPIKSKKICESMKRANLKRKYKKPNSKQIIAFTKRIKKYYKAHKVWNKGLKTGLIPKTAFKKGQIPYNKFLPSYLQAN